MPQFHDVILVELSFKQYRIIELLTLGFTYKANL